LFQFIYFIYFAVQCMNSPLHIISTIMNYFDWLSLLFHTNHLNVCMHEIEKERKEKTEWKYKLATCHYLWNNYSSKVQSRMDVAFGFIFQRMQKYRGMWGICGHFFFTNMFSKSAIFPHSRILKRQLPSKFQLYINTPRPKMPLLPRNVYLWVKKGTIINVRLRIPRQ
jgi:hypothetical protein